MDKKVPSAISKYRAADGRFRTLSLFKETIQQPTAKKYSYVFTLNTEDKDVPSLHKLFVESQDPTEYTFANEVLGSWTHWQNLKQCTWFKPYYEAMRLELDTKLQSKGVEVMRAIAKGKSPAAAQAARWFAEGSWDKKLATKRGRPSKEEVQGELKRQAAAESELSEDADRIGAVTNGTIN